MLFLFIKLEQILMINSVRLLVETYEKQNFICKKNIYMQTGLWFCYFLKINPDYNWIERLIMIN